MTAREYRKKSLLLLMLYMPCRSLPTQAHLKIWRQDKDIKQTLKEIVQERKHQFEKSHSESNGNDVSVGLMMLAADKDTTLKSGSAHFGMQSLIDACNTFYVEGHETTSSTLLTWTAMLLGTLKDWQDRAQAEVFEACDDHPPHALLDFYAFISSRFFPHNILEPSSSMGLLSSIPLETIKFKISQHAQSLLLSRRLAP